MSSRRPAIVYGDAYLSSANRTSSRDSRDSGYYSGSGHGSSGQGSYGTQPSYSKSGRQATYQTVTAGSQSSTRSPDRAYGSRDGSRAHSEVTRTRADGKATTVINYGRR
ncbi:MAG: hypothetical protein M1832_000775 [Thelocarpon impressellum]|nr:MAG: hypothetical protein M1832_000775 [Thelocarpon impressellum]